MNQVYFENIEYQIGKIISNSQSRLLIAVAWITNVRLAEKLINKKNIDIEIIVDDNSINRNSIALNEIQKASIDIKFIRGLDKNLMHNKFCISDNNLVVIGSYNWTNNANHNYESIGVLEDQEIAAMFTQEFRGIKDGDIDRGYSFSEKEVEKIVDALHIEIKKLIQENFSNDSLTDGDIYRLQNETVKNKIRGIDESIRNQLNKFKPTSLIYHDLIEKYGVFFHKSASEEELMTSVANFKRYMVKNSDLGVEILFQRFKLKAIDKLTSNYQRLLLKHDDDLIKTERIMKMFTYLRKEFNVIDKNIRDAHSTLKLF